MLLRKFQDSLGLHFACLGRAISPRHANLLLVGAATDQYQKGGHGCYVSGFHLVNSFRAVRRQRMKWWKSGTKHASVKYQHVAGVSCLMASPSFAGLWRTQNAK